MKNQHIPHLILGVPSVATPEEASIGFALASKRIKKLDNSPFSIEDLTAALATVESGSTGELRFEFALPADPGAIEGWTDERAASTLAGGDGDSEELATAHLYLTIQQLLQWDWVKGEESAKEVLRLSSLERTRDEALNTLALSLAMTGSMDRAMSALKQAVEGQWNIALQQNLGILAIEEDRELATNQATFWLDSARDAEERKQALLTVLGMLMSLQDDIADDTSDFVVIPPRVREAFRQALASDLPEETFGLLGTFMGQNDREWILQASNWAGAPLGGGSIANMILARAEGFEHFLDFLMDSTGSQSQPVQDSINRLVSDMNGIMLEEENAVGAAGVCMNLIDKGLDLSNFERVLTRPLTVNEICFAVGKDGGEPVEKVLDWLADAKGALVGLQAPEEAKEFLVDIIGRSGDLSAAVFHDSRAEDAQRIFDNLQQINYLNSTFSGRRRLNKNAVKQMAWEMRSWCLDTRRLHDKCYQVLVGDDIRQAWSDLMQNVYQLERNIQTYL